VRRAESTLRHRFSTLAKVARFVGVRIIFSESEPSGRPSVTLPSRAGDTLAHAYYPGAATLTD
jgi:hypothetical protein